MASLMMMRKMMEHGDATVSRFSKMGAKVDKKISVSIQEHMPGDALK